MSFFVVASCIRVVGIDADPGLGVEHVDEGCLDSRWRFPLHFLAGTVGARPEGVAVGKGGVDVVTDGVDVDKKDGKNGRA